jgi:hypothetical protein
LSLENTRLTLLRLQLLASGFETFAWRQKTKLSRLLTVFKKQPDIDKCIFQVNIKWKTTNTYFRVLNLRFIARTLVIV